MCSAVPTQYHANQPTLLSIFSGLLLGLLLDVLSAAVELTIVKIVPGDGSDEYTPPAVSSGQYDIPAGSALVVKCSSDTGTPIIERPTFELAKVGVGPVERSSPPPLQSKNLWLDISTAIVIPAAKFDYRNPTTLLHLIDQLV